MTGWFKVHRALQETGLWLSEPFTRGQAWVDLIGLANFEEGQIRRRGVLITIHRGQVARSLENLVERWKWSKGKVQRFLNELEAVGSISREMSLKNIRISSLITITNYDWYQCNGPENRPEDRPENEPGSKKNNKNNKNNSLPPTPQGEVSQFELLEFFEELWKVYPRKENKVRARKHYLATVKTDEDMDRIDIALGSYLEYIKQEMTEPQFIKAGSTWFESWEDWER